MRTPTEALKEIRDRLTYFCLRTDGRYDPPWATELVGIIDETTTDSHAVGNAAAMRDALKKIYDKVNSLDEECGVDPVEIRDIARVALSAQPRQCDVGTPEEQGERCLAQFDQWRRKGDGKKLITAIMNWAQTPYDANEGGAE